MKSLLLIILKQIITSNLYFNAIFDQLQGWFKLFVKRLSKKYTRTSYTTADHVSDRYHNFLRNRVAWYVFQVTESIFGIRFRPKPSLEAALSSHIIWWVLNPILLRAFSLTRSYRLKCTNKVWVGKSRVGQLWSLNSF